MRSGWIPITRPASASSQAFMSAARQPAADRTRYLEKYSPWIPFLEILTAFQKSSDAKAYYPMETRYTRFAPMENNPMHGILD